MVGRQSTIEFDPYTKMALGIFGGFVEANEGLFSSLRDDIRRAGMKITIDEYISTGILTAILSPLMTSPVAFVVCIALALDAGSTIAITFLVGLITSILVISLLYFYPSIKSEGMKKNITINLPFATLYLSTLAGTGMTTHAIFKILADFPEYGEISRQAHGIIADTEVFGLDIASAMVRAADRTPSSELKELFWGIRSTITTGGDLKIFLLEKAKGYMAEYRRSIDFYVEELSLFSELYITAVIVGSIFFIIMSTIMNMVGSGNSTAMVMIQNLVVYLLLPLVSIGFMMLVSMISPTT